jgi:hypothetical protein
MSQKTSTIATRVSQHEQQAIANRVSQHEPAVIDLSEEVEFLQDDMVIQWLFVDWQKQIQRATNTRYV